MSEKEHLFIMYGPVKIGWKMPEAKNIVCCLCMDQHKLTCCGTKKLLAKHILSSHPEVLKA